MDLEPIPLDTKVHVLVVQLVTRAKLIKHLLHAQLLSTPLPLETGWSVYHVRSATHATVQRQPSFRMGLFRKLRDPLDLQELVELISVPQQLGMNITCVPSALLSLAASKSARRQCQQEATEIAMPIRSQWWPALPAIILLVATQTISTAFTAQLATHVQPHQHNPYFVRLENTQPAVRHPAQTVLSRSIAL